MALIAADPSVHPAAHISHLQSYASDSSTNTTINDNNNTATATATATGKGVGMGKGKGSGYSPSSSIEGLVPGTGKGGAAGVRVSVDLGPSGPLGCVLGLMERDQARAALALVSECVVSDLVEAKQCCPHLPKIDLQVRGWAGAISLVLWWRFGRHLRSLNTNVIVSTVLHHFGFLSVGF